MQKKKINIIKASAYKEKYNTHVHRHTERIMACII